MSTPLKYAQLLCCSDIEILDFRLGSTSDLTCRDFCRVLIFQAGTNAPALAHDRKEKDREDERERACMRIIKLVPQ
eukprot:scaffold21294_cov92-Skeletonema_marinoi.AAC.1